MKCTPLCCALLLASAVPACQAGSEAPAGVRAARARVDGLLGHPTTPVRAGALELRREGSAVVVVARPGRAPAGASRAFSTVGDGVELTLPATAGQPFTVSDRGSGLTVRAALRGASSVPPAVSRGLVVYPGALAGHDVVLRPGERELEDFVAFDTRPAQGRVEYEVALGPGVAGLRQVSGVLEFLEAGGAPRLRVGPSFVVDAKGTWHEVALALTGCAADRSPVGPWGRPVTPPGAGVCQVVFTWDDAETGFYPAVFDPSWSSTGQLALPRAAVEAVLLPVAGKVLVTGGAFNTAFQVTKTTELFDEPTGTWSQTGDLVAGRYWYGLAVAPPNGGRGERAVIVGGVGANLTMESYSVTSGTWTLATGAMQAGREYANAVTLADGRIFTSGGQVNTDLGAGPCLQRNRTTEFYSADTNAIAPGPSLLSGRVLHSMSVLADGRILVTGGVQDGCTASSATAQTSELLGVNGAGAWSAGPALLAPRATHATLRLPSNNVLVAGGDQTGTSTTSEVYVYAAGQPGSFAASSVLYAGLTGPVEHDVLTPLPGGLALFAGGRESVADSSLSTSRSFDPGTNTWTAEGALGTPRREHGNALLPSGRTLLVGGASGNGGTLALHKTAESFDRRAKGQTCASRGECASELCADGVCCDSACTGACDACNLSTSLGTCAPSPSGTVCNTSTGPCDPAERCTGVATTCPANVLASAGTVCRPATGGCDVAEVCAGGTASCPADLVQPLGTLCGAFRCDGAAASCPSTCTSSTQCAPGTQCSGSSCRGQGDAGAGCTSDADCFSAFCENGVCCTSRCGGGCDACDALGACAPLPAGAAGAPACAPYLCGGGPTCPTSCTSTAQCSVGQQCIGAVCRTPLSTGGACVAAADCASGYCVDGVCCNTPCAGECESCAQAGSVGTCALSAARSPGIPSCEPYTCTGATGVCPASCGSSLECAAGITCAGSVCGAGTTRPNGASCTADTQCKSAFCADGFCCDVRCDGACEACDVNGAQGTCTPAAKGSPGAPVCRPFTCDGKKASCPTACVDDGDCAAASRCESGVCAAPLKGHIGCGCGADGGSGPMALGLLGLWAASRRRRPRPAR